MSEAFTVYWPQDRVKYFESNLVGRSLEVLYGGPHQSEPSFLRAKVAVGDSVFPIYVRDRILHVMGCMTVQDIVSFEPDEQGAIELEKCYQRFPDWRFLAPTCTNEVVLGHGSTLRTGIGIPIEVLQRLTYRSQRAERKLKHLDDDGKLTHSLGVQGIYRLTARSAADLADLLA
ncbi:hypothetical protein GCM10027589_12550 [Actinocorallia lasiicapitis]